MFLNSGLGTEQFPLWLHCLVLHRTLNVELCKVQRRIPRVEAITPDRGVALLIEGGDIDTSEVDETEDDSSDED